MDIFNNEHEVLTVGNLTIENRLGSVIIHGDVQITADDAGPAQALADFAQKLLLATKTPSTQDMTVKATEVIDNPFA